MIIDQLFTPKPLEEGGPYDLPGKDYDRPGDTPRKQSSGENNPYPYSPEEDDDYFREIFRKKREAAAKVEQGVAEKAGDLRPKLGSARDKGKSVRKWRNERGLNEARLMEDPIYRDFRRVGRYIAERKMSEKEILDVFAQAEAGMTNTSTGANRTMLGRGKDATTKFAGDVSDSVKGVLDSLRTSVPVEAVEVAYDQATDALANVAGGQDGAVMQAIKKYRMLAKQYPKTTGLVKGALLMIAGMATSGVAPVAIIGAVGALDRALKGNTLFNSLVGGASDTALAAAGQAAFGSAPADASDVASTVDPGAVNTGSQGNQLTPQQQLDAGMDRFVIDGAQDWVNADPAGRAEIEKILQLTPDEIQKIADSNLPRLGGTGPSNVGALADPGSTPGMGAGFAGGQYTVQPGDQIDYIAQAMGVRPQDITGLNPQINFTKPLQLGTVLDLPPQGDYTGNLYKDYVPGSIYGDKVAGATGGLTPKAVQESIKLKTLPAEQMIDQKSTVLNWALNESVGRKSNSVNLTTIGTLTVFENVDRYRRALLEYTSTQPGRPELPNLLRPDMPGAPVTPDTNPGMIGRGLNALDRFTSKVGGGLSNFGRQFTTGVTKEKLKMKWQQDGKPTDSDQLAAWLVTQKVPQQVVTSVFSNMSIPYTAQPAAPKTGGASTQAYAGINPATRKPWTQQELRDKFYPEPAATDATDDAEDTTGGGTGAFSSMAGQLAKPSTTSSTGGTTSVDQAKGITTNRASANNPNRQAATAAGGTGTKTTTSPSLTPSFSSNPTDMKVTYGSGFKPTTATLPAGGGAGVKAAAQTKPGFLQTATDKIAAKSKTQSMNSNDTQAEIKAGLAARQAAGLGAYESKTNGSRIFQALKRPVTEMLQMVETKEDVQKIKQFVDDTFIKYGAVNESAFAVRNRIIEHVTQTGAQRRREHSQRVAH